MYRMNRRLVSQKDIDMARRYSYGYIGGEEVAQKATDDQIAQLIVLRDRAAYQFNKSRQYERQFDNIVESIESR